MSDLDNIILNKYGANCVGYWPLNGNTNDLKSGNHLSGGTAGTYVNGPDGEKAMLFNGTTQSISTASTIDLTGTTKCTLTFWWYPNVYDTTNQEVLAEFSANYNLETTGFVFIDRAAVANDPLEAALKGDVDYSFAYYYPSTFGFLVPKWHHICVVYDKSATVETYLYINGKLATADARTDNANSNAFGNHTLYIASRANASLFTNQTFSKIALFDTALTANQVKEIYAYMRPGYSILNWMSYFDDAEIKRGYRYGD